MNTPPAPRRDLAAEPEVARLCDAVKSAAADRRVLLPRGGATRDASLGPFSGEPLALAAYAGIVRHTPTELVVTARAGTPLVELVETLAAAGQRLPFEPPLPAREATLGGAVALGTSGPARAYRAALRDALLGVTLIDGTGTVCRFGGEVMKNVAGFDVSRLMAGSYGELGAMLEISLRLEPLPEQSQTQALACTLSEALARMPALAARAGALSGLAWLDGWLLARFEGSAVEVELDAKAAGGETLPPEDAAARWARLREGPLSADGDGALWCLSVPNDAPALALPDANWALDWGGARRWVRTTADPGAVAAMLAPHAGHGLRLTPGVMRTPQPAALRALEQRVRQAMDPAGVFAHGATPGEGP
jgi:glycolate oxidase FAD binding subunit